MMMEDGFDDDVLCFLMKFTMSTVCGRHLLTFLSYHCEANEAPVCFLVAVHVLVPFSTF